MTLALLVALSLAACDRPAVRVARRTPPPVPIAPPGTEIEGAAPPVRLFPDDPPNPVVWNPAKASFEFKGQPLRAEKVWTFDGATDGFVATHGDVSPADGAGLSLRVAGRDTILRTPRGLNVAGVNRSLVLVRLTRTGAAKRLDPTAYYSTAAHGESQAWFAKPVFGGHPRLNDTVTMVFDMHRLAAGADDWKTSTIDQVRLDLDDGPGGAFVIRQVAIAQDPGGLLPALPAPPKATEPDKPAEAAKFKAADGPKAVDKPAAKKVSETPAKPKPKPKPASSAAQ
jgi:hypothetical protein